MFRGRPDRENPSAAKITLLAAILPSEGTRQRRRRSKPAQRWAASEHQIHVSIVEHLRLFARSGVAWHHVGNGEQRDGGTAAKLARMGLKAGVPDLAFVIGGRAHFLELKRERGGRLSPEQIAMHTELRAAGAVVETAIGLDHALAILTAWGVFRPDRHHTQARAAA